MSAAAAAEFETLLSTDSGVVSFLRFVDRLLARFFSSEGGGAASDAGSVQHLEYCVRCIYLIWDTFCGELMRRMPQTGENDRALSNPSEVIRLELQLCQNHHSFFILA